MKRYCVNDIHGITSLPAPELEQSDPGYKILSGASCARAAAKDRLRNRRDEKHVDDERSENHDDGDEVRQPHSDGIVTIEGLLQEGVHEAFPHENESGCDGADHREAE